MADCVEDRGLTVVNVTHNNNDRRRSTFYSSLSLAVVEQTVLDGNNDYRSTFAPISIATRAAVS